MDSGILVVGLVKTQVLSADKGFLKTGKAAADLSPILHWYKQDEKVEGLSFKGEKMTELEVISKDGRFFLELKKEVYLLEEMPSNSPEEIKKAGEELIGRLSAGLQAYVNREARNHES